MKNIWMYWEDIGRGMPEFVRLCIASVTRHKGSATVHMLDQKSVLEFLPNLRPEWHQLRSPAHKADYIRTRLALKYGGMWLDCDMAALRPLEPLFDFPARYDFACQGIDGAIGCFVARSGCELLERITRAQDEVLDKNPQDFPWNGIGNDLLKRLGVDYKYHEWQRWTLDEIAGGKVSKLLSTQEKLADNLDRNAVIFHFCGNILTPLLRTYARHQHQNALHERMLLSQIFRHAMGLNEPKTPEFLPSLARLQDAGDAVARRLSRIRKSADSST